MAILNFNNKRRLFDSLQSLRNFIEAEGLEITGMKLVALPDGRVRLVVWAE